MTAEWNPALVSDELITLTRRLGDPAHDLVILAEGNTSQRLDDGRIAVKASGANMATSTRDDFVIAEVPPLAAMIASSATTQEELTSALDAGQHEGARRRGSIETLIHVAVQTIAPTAFVAHTHPTAVVSLLASVHAETAFDRPVYSDELVVTGKPLFVPYAQPGIELGQLFAHRLDAYAQSEGSLPSLVLLGNHGIVAIASSAAGAEAISLMAVKGARVRLAAYAAGGVAALSAESVAHYFEREDFHERRKNLAGTA
ncbi:class II aldolase/adducin family protein [Microbacterium sp. NPDC076911]|uniref:class II aldolase/adducin family protein n=1 Tax=Microbacterium sp. NPDC076911 TaxID=3154958 RepID=UPI00344AF59D